MDKISYMMKSKDGNGFAVFTSRGNESDTCVLPFSKYTDALMLVRCYQKLGYIYRAIRQEGDLK